MGNNLTVILQFRCDSDEKTGAACQGEIRDAGIDLTYGESMPFRRYAHIGEPCRRYYGKDPATSEGFPVNDPTPIRRCADCWPHGDKAVGEANDPVGLVTTNQEAWGDRTVCSSCDRSNYYSIGD